MNRCHLVIAAVASLACRIDSANAAPAPELHWYRCNTHTHTRAFPQSDANETVDFVAKWYRTHGYQCLVITDHEFFTDVAPANRKYSSDGKFLVIRGQEISQAIVDPSQPNGYRYLHVNGLNTDKLIMPLDADVKDHVSEAQIYARNFAAIRAAGGIPQVNHPNLDWSVRLDDLLPLAPPYLFEVWNAFTTSNNLGGVAENGDVGPSAEALWDALLSRGKVVWGVASDDAHEYHKFDDRNTPTPGKAWIVIQAASLTVPAITDALATGKFYASTGISLQSYSADRTGISVVIRRPDDWNPMVKTSTRYVTRFIGANGHIIAEQTGLSPQYRFKGDEQYIRASIIDSDGRRAWTQPVFRDNRNTLVAAAVGAPLAEQPPPAQEPPPSQEPKTVSMDADAVAHFPEFQVPYSDLGSPQGKANLLQYLENRQLREILLKGVTDPAEVRRIVNETYLLPTLQKLRQVFAVDIRPQQIGRVATAVVTPSAGIAAGNQSRVLINLPGSGGDQIEAVPIAALGAIKVIAVNYGMAPDAKFPAASEDVATVYREVLKHYRPQNIGIYGCSSGAELTVQSIAWFRSHDLPRPGAIGLFGGGGVVDRLGDAGYTAAPLGGYDIQQGATASQYLSGFSASDPLVSPAYHDDVLKAFPPSLIITGTRDLGMSAAVYTHERLVALDVAAELHVMEGAQHCFMYWDLPESRQAWKATVRFFDNHLGRKRD